MAASKFTSYPILGYAINIRSAFCWKHNVSVITQAVVFCLIMHLPLGTLHPYSYPCVSGKALLSVLYTYTHLIAYLVT